MAKQKKDNEIYYTLTQIVRIYRVHLNKIKEALVSNKICKLDGIKVVPLEKYISSGEVKEFEDTVYGNSGTYYRYRKDLLKKLFPKKANPKLNPINWEEATQTILDFSDKLEKLTNSEKGFYYCEVPNNIDDVENIIIYIDKLLEYQNSFSKDEQKIIYINLSYLLKSRNPICKSIFQHFLF